MLRAREDHVATHPVEGRGFKLCDFRSPGDARKVKIGYVAVGGVRSAEKAAR